MPFLDKSEPVQTMNFIDIWTVVTGTASIISLLVVMSDKLPMWKKYIAPVGFLLGGVAIGRITYGLSPGAGEIFKDARAFGFIMILLLVLVVLVIFAQMMIKREQDLYSFTGLRNRS